VLEMMFASAYEPWVELAADRSGGGAEKKRIADEVIERLDARYPGLAAQVEVVDVTTPLTYERYTSNWKGSMEGWLVTTGILARLMRGENMKKTLPGLEGFYMVGQWVEPGGGVPAAALSGRNATQLLCHAARRPFVTSIP
jgi:phytoene dehydrogenase-like protein